MRDMEPTKVTLQDVATAAGVSLATASRVLGKEHTDLVRSEVQERVRDAARQLGYRHNHYASSLRRGRSRTIALLMRAEDMPISVERMNAMERAVWERGYQVLLLHCGVGDQAQIQMLKQLSSYRVDGMICSEPNPEVGKVLGRLAADVPIVTLLPVPGQNLDCVTVDRAHGAYLAARHLIGLGHRCLGALMHSAGTRLPNLHPTILQRLEGLRRACREADCSLDEDCISYRSERPYAAGYDGVRELWERRPQPPTALLCTNDQFAIGALRAFQEMGVRVPEEVALVGFDNLPEGAYARVPLTTLAQPVEEQAQRAVSLLFERMESRSVGTPTKEVTTIALPPKLVIRESCGARLKGVTSDE